MNDTGFHVPAAKIDRLATAHRPEAGRLVVADLPFGGRWSLSPRFEQGDAGLVSTADDDLAFLRLLLAGRRQQGRSLLSVEAVKVMTTNHLTLLQRQGGKAAQPIDPGAGCPSSTLTAMPYPHPAASPRRAGRERRRRLRGGSADRPGRRVQEGRRSASADPGRRARSPSSA